MERRAVDPAIAVAALAIDELLALTGDGLILARAERLAGRRGRLRFRGRGIDGRIVDAVIGGSATPQDQQDQQQLSHGFSLTSAHGGATAPKQDGRLQRGTP